ncbi:MULTISPECIES: lysozyme inhibitor LprI family protein [Luteimonas]|uniref:lysozyme inhibitor LprI family protein n=1 Tax=Luteimonas TaxID=83614 RepID=UPI000C7A5BB8|nr:MULTISPECIES: lysozyme inhibitor LprI family protein [Luteimonas]
MSIRLVALAAVLGAGALACTSARAADDASAGFGRCMQGAGGVTADMLDCIGDETRLQDARLNTEYRDTMSAVSTGQQVRLRAAQRAWLQYRDANCRFRVDLDGGTLASVASADCVRTMTTERASELARLRPQT